MEKETDDKVAVVMVDAARKKFPNLKGCSFDKGFYTPANKKELKTRLDIVVLPKKGKPIKLEGRRDLRDIHGHKRRHSAVESAINALRIMVWIDVRIIALTDLSVMSVWLAGKKFTDNRAS